MFSFFHYNLDEYFDSRRPKYFCLSFYPFLFSKMPIWRYLFLWSNSKTSLARLIGNAIIGNILSFLYVIDNTFKIKLILISNQTYSSFSNMSRTSKNHCQKCHSNVDTVLGLSKVSGTWIHVKFCADLEYSRQGMHHYHFSFGARH